MAVGTIRPHVRLLTEGSFPAAGTHGCLVAKDSEEWRPARDGNGDEQDQVRRAEAATARAAARSLTFVTSVKFLTLLLSTFLAFVSSVASVAFSSYAGLPSGGGPFARFENSDGQRASSGQTRFLYLLKYSTSIQGA